MRYHISHTTIYHYSQPVRLSTHTLRLRPRSDGIQQLANFSMEIQPLPIKASDFLDLEGNACHQIWFPDEPTTTLLIHSTSEIETHRTNPFDYLSEPWATHAPLDYPVSTAVRLTPYLAPPNLTISPQVIEFAQTLLHSVEANVGFFLTQLTQSIYSRCEYVQRHVGGPQPAGITLAQQSGTCRDFVVLFMEACRAVGLAARFVSGYQEGDPDQDNHDLHAWVEVYIPGGGWRGFDPTHGLAVTDRHIAVAAAAYPADAAPVVGKLKSGELASATLDSQIKLTVLSQ